MVYFSILASGTTMNAYLIDTHGSNAFHVLSLNHFASSVISYGTTFFANGLVLSAGIKRTLLVLGALQTAFWLSWIPMYVFGKRVRSFVSAPQPIRFDDFVRNTSTHSGVARAPGRAYGRSHGTPASSAETSWKYKNETRSLCRLCPR